MIEEGQIYNKEHLISLGYKESMMTAFNELVLSGHENYLIAVRVDKNRFKIIEVVSLDEAISTMENINGAN